MHDDAIPNERLKHQREIYGWSRNYVAEKIESDPRTVARWERGKTFPSAIPPKVIGDVVYYKA
jgi:transcriptional regulator with XRE-family HTH domain